MNIMTKRGSEDNIVTYEHYCDTKADLTNIPQDQIALGSVAIVLKDEDDSMGIYLANSNKEWISFSTGGGNGGESSIDGDGSGGDFAGLIDGTITKAHDSTVTSIRDAAFSGCTMLSDIDFPNVESIGTYAFASCPITKAIFPKCTSMGSMIFGYNNVIIQEAFYGALTSLPESAFYDFSQLTSVGIPNCERINTAAFGGCSSLSEVILPKCSYIDGTAFGRCVSLESLYVLSSSVAILSKPNQYVTPFSGTKIPTTGHIYVPASLISAYETAREWSAFSSRFEGLTDEEIAEILGE